MGKNRVFLISFILLTSPHAVWGESEYYHAGGDDYPWKVDRAVSFPHEEYSTIEGFNILYENLISEYSGETGAKLLKSRNYHNLLFEIVMETKGHPGGETYCKNGETVLVYRGFWVGDEGDVICHITLYMDMACEEYKKDEEAFYTYFGLDPGGA